jgi:hypothetical protein
MHFVFIPSHYTVKTVHYQLNIGKFSHKTKVCLEPKDKITDC